jgi:protein TonB
MLSEEKRMPLNVRRFHASAFGILIIFLSLVLCTQAQTVAPTPTSPVIPQQAQVQPPTSGDVMRGRISKAKAYIAVRNYNAAIYELENIRKESADTAVQSVTSVLLMNSYLELGDYRRAQEFLNQLYAQQKTAKANAATNYTAVAGQIVSGARLRAERYRALGLSVADRTLPLEALNDLEKMRETLELVITQSKEISQTPARAADAIALLEEATSSRSMLARDDYDARAWKEQVADMREQMAVNGKVVLSAVNETATNTSPEFVATKNAPSQLPLPQTTEAKQTRPRETETRPAEKKVSETLIAKNDAPIFVPSAPAKENPKPATETPKIVAPKDNTPIDAGSLLPFATRQASPVYPPAAKTMRTKGVVRVDVTINETGDVAEVQKTSGPAMLQGAAKDAIKKWKFKPFVRDGQPVRATGFVSFNFAL